MKKRTKKIEEQIKTKTWEKFWQYKIAEIMGVLIFIFIPYYVGIFLSKVHPVITRWFFEGFSMPYSFLVIWTIGILGIILLVCVLAVPIFWIYANWKKAKENAEEEVTGESGYCIW